MMAAESEPLVLVTGAAGYLGSQVVKLLQEQGHRVRASVRDVKDEKKVGHLTSLCPDAKYKLEVVQADLMIPSDWGKAVKDCTYVHHIACPMPLESPKDDEKEMLVPTMDGTKNVLTACHDSGTVKRVILTSSLFAMGCKGDNPIPLTENDWLNEKMSGLPMFPKSKLLQEKFAWDYVKNLPEDKKFELVVLNLGFMMGPLLMPYLCNTANVLLRFLDGRMPMVPKFNFNVCDVRDAAAAHVKAMTCNEAAGHRHILCAGTVWMKEWGEILSQELANQGYKIPTKEIPGIFISVAAKLDKDINKVKFFASHPINADNSRQINVLQIEPIEKSKTLIDMAHSMIQHGLVKQTTAYQVPEVPSEVPSS